VSKRIVYSIIITAIMVIGVLFYLNKFKIRENEVKEKYEYLPIYGFDSEAMNIEVNFYVKILKDEPLIDKLKILADKLSGFIFKLPIEVLRIEERKGKKIAVINLREGEYPSEYLQISWKGLYFQGSTGGYFTTITLRKTFLQDSYRDDWIDGVEFYYEGEPIKKGDWNHISLSGTINRLSIRSE
jgi:hypothetical protein